MNKSRMENSMEKTAKSKTGGSKALIVYYSWSGNTREVAGQIQRLTGGRVVELETVDPYPHDYDTVVRQAKQELASGFNPPLKALVKNIDSYDIIFLGSPNWWSTAAPPVKTFLAEHDLTGKTVAPFITHGGGGLGRYAQDIAAMCPGSTVLDSLVLSGGDRENRAEQGGPVGRRDYRERPKSLGFELPLERRRRMGEPVSRRAFLSKSALALGAVLVFDFADIAGAKQVTGVRTLSAQEYKEETMPHVIVKLWPGRSEQQKARLAEEMVKDVVEIMECGEGSVSVAIEEVSSGDWKEKVYDPKIKKNMDKLYKKPGYSM